MLLMAWCHTESQSSRFDDMLILGPVRSSDQMSTLYRDPFAVPVAVRVFGFPLVVTPGLF